MKTCRLVTVWGVWPTVVWLTVVLGSCVLGSGIEPAASLVVDDGIDLRTAHIVIGERASSQERFAGRELRGCLSRL
jgi:hypothetical protein